MKVVDKLVEQCRESEGLPGIIMTRIMNIMDTGLNKWALRQSKFMRKTNASVLQLKNRNMKGEICSAASQTNFR